MKTETKVLHTAGPWVAVSEINKFGYTIEPEQGSKQIAIIPSLRYGLDNEGTVAQANAKLIAAAPDLLKALQYILSNLDGMGGIKIANRSQADEAIRKATL